MKSVVTGSFVLWVVGFLVLGYGILVLLMYLFQSAFIYFPSNQIVMTPAGRDYDYEDVFLYTEDQIRLHGWYVPAPEDRGTLLFFHGNAGNISGRIESISIFHDLGLNVMIFDYRGYGKSDGRPSEIGTYRDAGAVWWYLTEVREESPARIILFGRSLGGGVAAWLASEVHAGALVLESTFTSTVDLAGEWYPLFPVRGLMHIRYPVLDYLPNIDVPVMVAHSREDKVIPYHHGQRIFEQAGEPKRWLEMQGGHNDGYILTGHLYIQGWDRFLKEFIHSRR